MELAVLDLFAAQLDPLHRLVDGLGGPVDGELDLLPFQPGHLLPGLACPSSLGSHRQSFHCCQGRVVGGHSEQGVTLHPPERMLLLQHGYPGAVLHGGDVGGPLQGGGDDGHI